MTDLGKGAILLSQIESLCPEPKVESLDPCLYCTSQTVPPFPPLGKLSRESNQNAPVRCSKCLLPVEKESRRAAGIRILTIRQESKPPGNWQPDMPELVFMKCRSLGESSTLASDTKISLKNILKEQPCPGLSCANLTKWAPCSYLLKHSQPSLHSVLASQLSWMTFASLVKPLMFPRSVTNALVSFWHHILNPLSSSLDPFMTEESTLLTLG